MNKKTSSLFYILSTLIILGVVFLQSFYHYYHQKNYPVFSLISCDPSIDSCFIANEDTANFFFAKNPYKKVVVSAKYAPICLDEHTCTDFKCNVKDSKCTITDCNENSIEESERCILQEK